VSNASNDEISALAHELLALSKGVQPDTDKVAVITRRVRAAGLTVAPEGQEAMPDLSLNQETLEFMAQHLLAPPAAPLDAAAIQEACAKACDELQMHGRFSWDTPEPKDCAEKIRGLRFTAPAAAADTNGTTR